MVFPSTEKMAATFFTDKNCNRKQMSKDKSCNLRQIRSRSFKEVRYGSNMKKEQTFHKKPFSSNKNKKLSNSKPTKQAKLDDYFISMSSPLQAKNLLEHIPHLNNKEHVNNTPTTTEDYSERLNLVVKKNIMSENGRAPPSLQKQSPSSPSKFPSTVGGVSELLSSMAANFKAVDKTGHSNKLFKHTSPIFGKDSKSPSPPLLSPSISPKTASSFYGESRRTSRSSTSSFKENISDNIPSQSNIVAEISKPVLRPINKENSRSPLSRRCNNIQSIPEIRSTPPKIEQPIIIAKKENTDNKSEKREELEFIKGKKCIKCGYSSVKNSDLVRHVRCVHFKIRDFACHICSYKCFGSSSLGQHIKSVHLKIKDHACKICGYQASRRADINKHMRYRHKLKPSKIHRHVVKIECDSSKTSADKSVETSHQLMGGILQIGSNGGKIKGLDFNQASIKPELCDLLPNGKERAALNAPLLESINELPKVERRSLRSISPPKLTPEGAVEKSFSHVIPTDKDAKPQCPMQTIVASPGKEHRNDNSLCSPYRQTFREEWLKDPELSPWIQKFPPDATKAFCPICQMTIGSKHSSLITHSKSGGHDRCLKELKTKYKKQNDLKEYIKTSLSEYLERSNTKTNGSYLQIDSEDSTSHDSIHRRSAYRQIFRDEWLLDKELTPWLQKHSEDPTKAFCPVCSISLMAKHSTLVSHAKSGGHLNNVKAKKSNNKLKYAEKCNSPLRHNTSIRITQCDNPPVISNKSSPLKSIDNLRIRQPEKLKISSTQNGSNTLSSIKEKWEISNTEESNQKQFINARKMCPHCHQQQSQSNMARHIQYHCPKKKVKEESKKEKDEKKIGKSASDHISPTFKRPLSKESLLKSQSKSRTAIIKQKKRLKSKLKKVRAERQEKLKAQERNNKSQEKSSKNMKKFHRSGSISSNCSSSSSSIKSVCNGDKEIDKKTLDKLIMKQLKQEKKRLNPVQIQMLRAPLMCHLCTFTYSYADETVTREEIRAKLIEHFELVHVRKVVKEPSSDFSCDYCPYSAPFQLMLTSHIIVQHPEKEPKLVAAAL